VQSCSKSSNSVKASVIFTKQSLKRQEVNAKIALRAVMMQWERGMDYNKSSGESSKQESNISH